MSPRLYTGSMRLYGLLLNKLYIKDMATFCQALPVYVLQIRNEWSEYLYGKCEGCTTWYNYTKELC